MVRDWETISDVTSTTTLWTRTASTTPKQEDFDCSHHCPELQSKGLHWPEKVELSSEPAKVMTSHFSSSAIQFLHLLQDWISQSSAQPEAEGNSVMNTKLGWGWELCWTVCWWVLRGQGEEHCHVLRFHKKYLSVTSRNLNFFQQLHALPMKYHTRDP